MGLIKGLLYWGYVTDKGKIEVKRYVSDRMIANFERMPDVKGIFDPFYAYDIHHARELILERYNQENSMNGRATEK